MAGTTIYYVQVNNTYKIAGLTTEKLPDLQKDIRSLVDPNSQTYPTFETTFRYTRMTAKAVLEALVREKGYKSEKLPALSTMRELLSKMGCDASNQSRRGITT